MSPVINHGDGSTSEFTLSDERLYDSWYSAANVKPEDSQCWKHFLPNLCGFKLIVQSKIGAQFQLLRAIE